MRAKTSLLMTLTTALLLTGCASMPMGPTVRVLPGQNKPFEQFQMENASCKGYAADQVRGQADRANTTGLIEGVAGTALGAGLGAAIGGGQGAAIGAAGGALAGTAVGASTSSHDQRGIQQQYNDAYIQCMLAKGNQLQQRAVVPQQTTVIYQQPQPTVVYTQPAPTVIYTQPAPPPQPGW